MANETRVRHAFITGSSGFVGTHLARAARAAGYAVFPFDREASSDHDLLDRAALSAAVARARPDVVVHLAGALRATDPRALYDVNVGGTLNLLEACQGQEHRPTVVVVSSSAVYGGSGSAAPIGEDRFVQPVSHYGASKAAQEIVAMRAFACDGLPVLVTRVFNIVGPGQPASLAAGAFAERIARAEAAGGGTVQLGDLSAVRDFIDVRDVARALVAVAERGVPGATYNICSGIPTEVRRCVEEMARHSRRPITIESTPAPAGAHDVRMQVGDRSRIEHDTGWVPDVPFEQSMHDVLEWWREMIGGDRGPR